MADKNDLVPLPLTVNYGDMAHDEVPAAVVLCADTSGHGLVDDTIRRQSGKGCEDNWNEGVCRNSTAGEKFDRQQQEDRSSKRKFRVWIGVPECDNKREEKKGGKRK